MIKSSKFDFLLAGLIGLGGLALLLVWSFDGLHPFAWQDTAVAALLLPKGALLPGYGNMVGGALFAVLPFKTALAVEVVLAKLLMASCGVMLFYSLVWLMGVVSGFGARDLKRRRLAIRLAAAVSSIAFVCSEPMWLAAQGLTGTTLVIFLVVLATFLFARLLVTASEKVAVTALCVTGLLAAESLFGWLVLILGVVATVRFVGHTKDRGWMRFLDPERMQRTKWMMTFAFIGAVLVGILAEMMAFAKMDGLRALGVTAGELPILYFKTYGALITNSMNLLGVIGFVGAAVVPFFIATVMITNATDEDRFLSFKYTLVYFLTSLVVFLQLSPFDFAWFWKILDVWASTSGTVLAVTAFLSAMTLGWGLYVLAVEVLCRDYRHIEEVLYQSDSEEGGDVRLGRDNVESVRLSFGRLAMLLLPFALLAIVIPGRRLAEDRALAGVIGEFVRETLDEAVGTKYLFTDGSYDNLIRLEAKRRGQDIVPVSLMSGKSHLDAYVRQIGTEGFEDRVTLETGGAEALRTWVLSKSARVADISVQIAFEMFRLNRKLKPVVYGSLVRPAGADTRAAAASVARCHALSDKIVALHDNGTWRHAKDLWLKDLFLFAQFRLAVMSRLRAILLDAEKKTKESLEEIAYSDKLNAHNPSLVKILRQMDWVKRQTGEALTPREGLEVALKRADFVMARRYAMPILKENPDEPNANFALGMSYYAEEQFAKAEEYLKRVLKTSPKEPAIYNNLALIYLKTSRLEEAERSVRKAVELYPDSTEVKDTVKRVKEAFDKRRKPCSL